MAHMVRLPNKDYPDMTNCSKPQLTAYMSNYFLDAGLLQLTMRLCKQVSSSGSGYHMKNGFLCAWIVPA